MNLKPKKISLVVPVFCEEKNLERFYHRVGSVLKQLPMYSWEYVFVNDGSSDQSFQVLESLAIFDLNVKVLDFSKNFGKEVALTAGVHLAADSDAVICIDADLQHPPELIPQMVELWEAGGEIVATIRDSIQRQPLFRRVGSHLYYWLMSNISGLEMVSQTTDFRLYDKKVIQAFLLATERNRLFRGIMDWLGFKKVYINFNADARTEGSPGYTYSKLWALAINSITSFSLWPLRLTGYLGLTIVGVSGLLILWMLLSNSFGFLSSLYTPIAFFVVFNTLLIGVV